MNDFSELENQLRKLRPARPSLELFSRLEQALRSEPAEDAFSEKVVRPARFRTNWLALGAGLAAAAVWLLFARVDLKEVPKSPQLASGTPGDAGAAVSTAKNKTNAAGTGSSTPISEFIPDGATRVVYQTRDEGLRFPNGATEPVRRVRSRTRETLQWHNPVTGASLRVSYPSEQVELIPISGQ